MYSSDGVEPQRFGCSHHQIPGVLRLLVPSSRKYRIVSVECHSFSYTALISVPVALASIYIYRLHYIYRLRAHFHAGHARQQLHSTRGRRVQTQTDKKQALTITTLQPTYNTNNNKYIHSLTVSALVGFPSSGVRGRPRR